MYKLYKRNKLKFILVQIGLVVFSFVALSIFSSPKSYAANCVSPGAWVSAQVRVWVLNPNGTLNKESTNFGFNVATTDPSGYFHRAPGNAYWNQSIVAPGGAAAGTNVNLNSFNRMHYCGGSWVYDFTDGANGNYFLNCLWGVDHQHSVGYNFTGVAVYDAGPGDWVNQTASIAPTVFGNGTTTDLNKKTYSITLVYKLRPPPPSFPMAIYSGCKPSSEFTVDANRGSSGGTFAMKYRIWRVGTTEPGSWTSVANKTGPARWIIPIGPPGYDLSKTWRIRSQVTYNGIVQTQTKDLGPCSGTGSSFNTAINSSCTPTKFTVNANRGSPGGTFAMKYHIWEVGTSEPSGWTAPADKTGPASWVINIGPPGYDLSKTWRIKSQVTYNGTTQTKTKDLGPCSTGGPPTDYKIVPHLNQPIPDDYEDPTKASYTLNTYDVQMPSGGHVPTTDDITVTRSIYYVKGGAKTLIISPDPTFDLTNTQKGSGPHSLSDYIDEAVSGLTAGDTICQDITFSPGKGKVNSAGKFIDEGKLPVTVNNVCARIRNNPYVSVYGGDAIAGGEVNNGSAVCGSGAIGKPIAAFWKSSTNTGAGVELAAFASGLISAGNPPGFASAKLRSATAPTRPKDLSFANDTATLGSFGAANCVSGYGVPADTVGAAISGTIDDLNTVALGAHHDTTPGGTLTIKGGSLGNSKKIVIWVNGDVHITGATSSGIVYSGASTWGSFLDIPSFVLIAGGDILIDNNVTTLDGTYVAHGTINTCSDGTSNYFVECNNQLTVHGSLIANNIKWLRTKYSLRDGTANESPYGTFPKAAEVIISGPEQFLTKSKLPDLSGSGSSTGYDSITSLPPIL